MTEIRTPEDRETLDRRDVQRRIDLTLKSVARYIDRTARPGERQSIIAALAEAQEYVAILAARQPAPSAEDRERCGVCDRDGGQHWYDHFPAARQPAPTVSAQTCTFCDEPRDDLSVGSDGTTTACQDCAAEGEVPRG